MASFTSAMNQVMSSTTKSLKTFEWVLLVAFVLYFVFPITFPRPVYVALESIPGLVLMFCIIVYLFIYCHPVLGVFSILAAYEFYSGFGRSYSPATAKTAFLEYSPPQIIKDRVVEQQVADSAPLRAVLPPSSASANLSLEEEIIQQMAPIGHSEIGVYVDSRFQPVADPVGGASMYV